MYEFPGQLWRINSVNRSNYAKDSFCHPDKFPNSDILVGKLVNKACDCSNTDISGCNGDCNAGDIDWFMGFAYLLSCDSTSFQDGKREYTIFERINHFFSLL